MKKSNFYVLGVLVLLVGCSSADSKYKGWEQVRVERTTPNAQCKYIAQEVCYPNNSHEGCTNFHKKKAALNGANTVVLDSPNSTGDGGILADYYYCTKN